MSFNQIKIIGSENKEHIKHFEGDFNKVLLEFMQSSGITILPLAVKALSSFLGGGTIDDAAKVFFTNMDLLIILVSVVSSAAFVSYKHLKKKFIWFICWCCVWLSFGVYQSDLCSLDFYRGIMWFMICIVFSLINIFASQYIPTKKEG